MDYEYSEIVFNNIMSNTNSWLEQFKNSNHYKELSKKEKEDAEFIIKVFTEWNYDYELRRPREWTQASLSYVLLDPFIRKISVERSFYKHVEPVLTQYFLFLNDLGKIKNGTALIKSLKEVAPIMIEDEKESSNWGFGKQFMSSGESMGIDMSDEKELQKFIGLFNQMIDNGDIENFFDNE